jgi:LCP family protein required for cell wall assembly
VPLCHACLVKIVKIMYYTKRYANKHTFLIERKSVMDNNMSEYEKRLAAFKAQAMQRADEIVGDFEDEDDLSSIISRHNAGATSSGKDDIANDRIGNSAGKADDVKRAGDVKIKKADDVKKAGDVRTDRSKHASTGIETKQPKTTSVPASETMKVNIPDSVKKKIEKPRNLDEEVESVLAQVNALAEAAASLHGNDMPADEEKDDSTTDQNTAGLDDNGGSHPGSVTADHIDEIREEQGAAGYREETCAYDGTDDYQDGAYDDEIDDYGEEACADENDDYGEEAYEVDETDYDQNDEYADEETDGYHDEYEDEPYPEDDGRDLGYLDDLYEGEEHMPEELPVEKKKSNKGWTAVFIVMVLTLAALCVVYLKQRATLMGDDINVINIKQADIVTNEGVAEETKGYTTIALYGVDSTDGNKGSGTNSDCVMLLSINNATGEMKIVSVYRDTLLETYGMDNGAMKINYAYQMGGALTSINTLNTNLDLNITDFVTIDFDGLASIINAIGGVTIDVDESELDAFNSSIANQIKESGNFIDGIHSAGKQVLNGEQAVAYSRIRTTDKGDITRTERQRKVLFAIAGKVKSMDAAATVLKFVDVSFGFVSTSITRDEMVKLAKKVSTYEFKEEIGFPMEYSPVILSDDQGVVAANDLSSNVKRLHEYLYGNGGYTVSSTVSTISDRLKSLTGVTGAGDAQAGGVGDAQTGQEADTTGEEESSEEATTAAE